MGDGCPRHLHGRTFRATAETLMSADQALRKPAPLSRGSETECRRRAEQQKLAKAIVTATGRSMGSVVAGPLIALLLLFLAGGRERETAGNGNAVSAYQSPLRRRSDRLIQPSEVFMFQGGIARLIPQGPDRRSLVLLVHCDSPRCEGMVDSELIIPGVAFVPSRIRLPVADDPRHAAGVEEASGALPNRVMLSFKSLGRSHLVQTRRS